MGGGVGMKKVLLGEIIIYIEINISMSKDQQDDYLRYGQGILLRGFKGEE